MTGFVYRIASSGTFCFIKDINSEEEFFAHKKGFPPGKMKLSQYVTFTPGPLPSGKSLRPAIDVRVINQAA